MSPSPEIKTFIIENFAPDVRPDELADDYDLLDNGVVDSLSLLRLIAWLGDRFGIAIDEIDITPDHFGSVTAIGLFITEFGAVSSARK